MASNSFGQLFRITTWGESHGKAIGVVIDGCPSGLDLSDADINQALAFRAPGKSPYTSPRNETDQAEILSGIFEGKTSGTPISIIIPNRDADSSSYESIKHLIRPGHANYTYLEKYGVFDYRGGGRASARETACRVAAGAVAKKLLNHFNIRVIAYIKEIGSIKVDDVLSDFESLVPLVHQSSIFCPDSTSANKMMEEIVRAKSEGDSLGGVVEFQTTGMPIGLGDPIYEKLEANLAKAMLSLPASKGFEIGSGFRAAAMAGSVHNDQAYQNQGKIDMRTNHAGGVLGGISSGMPIIGRVAFKPPSSIKKIQETLTIEGEYAELKLSEKARHDPCVAIRAVPVVEAMTALVLVDALLSNRCATLANF